jgi:hypothetical protein
MRRSRQIHIFATREDLLPGLGQAEADLEIAYCRCDELRYDSNFEHFASLLDWKELGQNTTGDHVRSYQLLVAPRKTKFRVERIPQRGGGVRYDVSQLRNPDTVSFLPGGIYQNHRALVCGHIGTASESQVSIALYLAFARAVTKGFEKIRAYRVGPEAARLMDQGYRMVTIGLGSPQEYDLRRD